MRQHGRRPSQVVRRQTDVLIVGELGWPLLDKGRPSNKLSRASTYWQRYLANDAQSEWAAREMQVRLDFIPRAGSLRLSAGTSRYRSLRLGRGHVDDFTHIASARPGRHSLFRNQRLYSDSAGPAAWSRNLC